MSNTTSKPTIYTDYQKLSIKDIVFLLVSVSEKTAQLYYQDIKKQYETPHVLFTHFKQYFKITEIVPKTN